MADVGQQDAQGVNAVGERINAGNKRKPGGSPCSENSAPERKKSGMTRKFMMSEKACMSSRSEPMIVPSEEKISAIKNMMNIAGNNLRPAYRLETEEQGDDQHDQSLNGGDGGAARGPADHDIDARHGSHQRFLQKSELAVPDDFHAGENRREDNAHADNAGRQIVEIVGPPAPNRPPKP